MLRPTLVAVNQAASAIDLREPAVGSRLLSAARSATMLTSVIIPTYNSASTLRLLLDSLLEQTAADYEVIVVDDASTDDTAELVRRYPFRYERLKTNQGPAAARNRGAELARGKWLVFTDADTVFYPDTLEHIATLVERSDAAALFGTYAGKPANAGYVPRYKALWEHYAIVMPFEGRGRELHPVSSWIPRPGVVRRDAFEAVEGFDTRFRGADLEDVEFGYRLHAAGFPIYFCQALRIQHHYPTRLGRSLGSFARRCALWMRMALRRRKLDPAGEGSPRQAAAHLTGFCAFLLVLATPLWPPLGWLALAGFVGYALWNARFVALARREQGLGFAVLSLGTCWLYTIVLGLSAGWGLASGLLGKR